VGGRIAEEWWQEVVLLAVGQPHHDVFAEVVGGALAAGALPEHAGLVGRALEEAHVARVEPFAKLIAAPGTPVRARAEALRLFMARRDAVVVEAARAFVEDADADVRELARGLTAWEPPEAPAPEAVEAGEAVALDLGEGVALALLPVPGGTFEMGEDASPHDDEKPAHAVTVPGFLLGETPVTNAQYGRFLAEAGHREPPRWSDARFSGPEQPVVTVSWDDARAFCRWLGGRAGLEVDLPTEARWERAARGEDGRRYPWGDEEPDETRVVFGRSRDKGTTEPVGSRPAGRGAYGHLDLAGNVWEWCLDDCDTGAYARRAGEVVEDPRCRVEGQGSRIGRGGSWLNAAESLRSAFRYWRPAGGRLDNIGFRVCAAPASTVR